MTVLNQILQRNQEAEIQAVYAIQNFVHKLEHPQSKSLYQRRSSSSTNTAFKSIHIIMIG